MKISWVSWYTQTQFTSYASEEVNVLSFEPDWTPSITIRGVLWVFFIKYLKDKDGNTKDLKKQKTIRVMDIVKATENILIVLNCIKKTYYFPMIMKQVQ